LHLELKFTLGRGWCVVLIWHGRYCKNWLAVKRKSSYRSCFAQTLLISSHAYTSRLTFLQFLRNWNQYQKEPTWQRNPNIYIYIYMTQEAIKTRKQAKWNCDDSLASS
jgi:hypothetical protein